jgi:acyl-phosphate glycerol 3-phosphate acyltransferase
VTFEIFSVFLLSYIFGSIPFGLILTKTFLNKDIRETGSKNIGATNVLTTGNKSVAILTLLLDIFKGVVPILVTKIYFPNLIYLSGLAAFLGHIFPVWLKFKGGKGVATYLGIIFALSLKLGLFFCVFWILVALITKYSSLASMISSLIIFIISFFHK